MRKKKFAATAVALAMAAVTAFSVGGNYVYADANSNADIAIQAEAVSESVVLPVSVASEAWIYSDGSREFGTWKALNIKVNDTMYPLSKDGAVNVTFSNGDEIKIYSGDSYELWEGTISISGDEVNVTSQNNKYTYDGHTGTTRWGCNLVYSDGSLILTKTQNHNGGGGVASTPQKIFYDYDLTAKTDAGVPIEGVSVVDEGSYGRSNNWLDMICFGYIQENNTWGNGNSFDLEETEGGRYFINSKRVTNKNGVIDMYLPEELKHSDTGFDADIYIGGDIYAELSKVGKKRVFVNNGLVDVTINDEYYASVTSFGLNATFNTIDTDEILGDYYYYSDELTDITSNNSVTLKDTFGNDIAVVTMGVKETEKQHLIGKENGNYKATGLEPVVDVKMADGVTEWTVSVTSDDNNNADNTLHINAVKSGTAVSSDNYTHVVTKIGQVNATCSAYGVKEYYKCSCGKYFEDAACEKEITNLDAWKNGAGRIAKKAHVLRTTTTKATISKNGKTETKCSVCGKVTKTTVIYAAKNISLSATSYTYDGKVKKPTVTVKDSKGTKIATSNYNVTYGSGRKNVGKYTVKVTFKGNYAGTVTKSFKINPKSTTISGITAKSKGFTVKWKKNKTQTTGYQIQYSTSSTFKSAKTVTVSKNATTNETISKLKAKKKYYVRIRTYKKIGSANYYSSWSKAKTVTTKR